MNERPAFTPVVGRTHELRELFQRSCVQRAPALVVSGPSGIGKTALVDHFVAGLAAGDAHFVRIWVHSLYRASWTSVLADLRRRLEWIPDNATVAEIESRLIESCNSTPTLIVLDNVEATNVHDVQRFVDAWSGAVRDSSVIVTAQNQVGAQFASLPTLKLKGLESDAAVLETLGDLTQEFSREALLDVGRLVGGNPQKLLFLSWIGPKTSDELRETALGLQRDDDQFEIEDFIENEGIPSLFFLALGIHRGRVVTDELLATLWDNFTSRGAAAYVRARGTLTQRQILIPIREDTFAVHESVHVRLEKALRHRVGNNQIPMFHRYFADYYAQRLETGATTRALTHFVHHSLAAGDYPLAYQLVTRRPSPSGSAVLARQELTKLDTPEAVRSVGPLAEARLCLRLGAVCNDLSDHAATLAYMVRADRSLAEVDDVAVGMLRRQIWY